jgi:hypothetical protein
LVGSDVLGISVLPEIALDFLGEIGVPGLSTRAGSVFSSEDSQTVMFGVGLLDVCRLDVEDLEGPEPNEPTQLEYHVVLI